MASPRLDLEQNPDFLADLLDETLSRDSICEKWNASAGFVSDRRRKARAGESIISVNLGGIAEAATPSVPPETTEITTNNDGTKQFNFIRHRPVTLEDARELIRSTGDDPALYNLAIKTIAYGDKSSNKISAWPKTGMALVEAAPLAELYKEAERLVIERPDPEFQDRTRALIVNVADMQLGKRGRRGATPETLARLESKRAKLRREIEDRRPGRILIADLGDGIEGFESGGNPMFTNDLSLPDQLDCYATEIFKFVTLAAEYAPVDVTVVASNHAAWRKGKQVLGAPSDDFGIYVHKQVQKIAEAARLDATWHYPDEYDESVRVDILGVPLGFVHGNQFGPGQAISWWERQAFGAQAVTHCDVMTSGHYHSYGAGVAGINPATGRERMWLGCPTLDNGSDWFRQTAGRDSEPGLLIFDVTPDGFDLGSLKIL